jgi:DNA-binding PadR family transcriptional regulator
MYADILILATLQTKPQHGYEIKKHIERILGGAIAMNNKVLYPTLKRFEEMGAVRREVERQEGKPDRHIYQLTERGTEILQGLLCAFTPEMASSEAEFLTRVAFFALLRPEARRAILTTRAEVVARRLAHLEQLKQLAREDAPNSFGRRVLQFHEQKVRAEADWIHELLSETRDLLERENT